MRPVRLLLALILGTGLAAGAVPARAAEPTDPLAGLVKPTYVDPLIELLVALPSPHVPYTGTICASGEGACVDEVLREMRHRFRPLAESCSHHSIFSLAYLRVTENVHDAVLAGYFDDQAWLNRVDAVFADMYFTTMDNWTAGRAVPPAWRVALDAADRRQMTGLGDFMLNMSAHINNDFPRTIAKVGLTAADGTSHKSDHNRYNQRLDTLLDPVFAEETARFDPSFDDYNFGSTAATVAGLIMRGWREMVWRNAEALANARTVLEKQLVSAWITAYAEAQTRFIKTIPIFLEDDAAARSAYCAAQQ